MSSPARQPPAATGRSHAPLLMVAAVAVAATSSASCRHARRPPGPVASTLVATAAELGAPPAALVEAWQQIDDIADRATARHRRTGAPLIDALTAVVFDDLKMEREIDDDDPRFFLLSSVLKERRGSCLGLGAVYLAVAERLGLPLDGVRVPGHFFVRTRDPSPRNIELLRRGETMPDDWYRQKYGPWPETAHNYFRALAPEELSALFWFNAGNFARRRGELARARAAYERASREAPDFAEAQASLGLTRQLEGALPDAEASYRSAARARPDLPGLDRNMALLQDERRAANFPLSPPPPTTSSALTSPPPSTRRPSP